LVHANVWVLSLCFLASTSKALLYHFQILSKNFGVTLDSKLTICPHIHVTNLYKSCYNYNIRAIRHIRSALAKNVLQVAHLSLDYANSLLWVSQTEKSAVLPSLFRSCNLVCLTTNMLLSVNCISCIGFFLNSE